VEIFAPLAKERRLALAAEHPPELPMVMCDRDRVVEVLDNLVTNAANVTPPGGSVRVGVASGGANEVRFFVADTGPGIKSEDLAHVFDRLWRAKSAGYKGSGRGLAI